jgi:hypothetical protein
MGVGKNQGLLSAALPAPTLGKGLAFVVGASVPRHPKATPGKPGRTGSAESFTKLCRA